MNLVLWRRILLTLAIACLVFATMQSQNFAAVKPESKKKAETSLSKPSASAPKTIKATIEVGPFDLHRKYRSMEGPYVAEIIRISDLLATAAVKVPESRVIFVEGGSSAPSMNGGAAGNNGNIAGLVDTSSSDKELYWFKSIKLQVLDENDRPLPSAEFICHLNVDADQVNRFMSFPDLERTGSSRVITITQGQTEFHFPDGYAVPVSSDEEWKFIFQAANRTTNEHRRVKHLCTIEFIKDSDLKSEMKALHWYNPYISVLLDESNTPPEHHGPGCLAISSAGNAPNMVPNTNFKDDKGRNMSSHWSIPPGRHVYRMPITEYSDPAFSAEDRKIHAVWTHIHPFCTNTTLAVCNGDVEKPVFSVDARTKNENGPELEHIDNIISKDGIPLSAKQNYTLSATYDNPLKENLDSMVALGVFFESKTFKKPEWVGAGWSARRPESTKAGNASGDAWSNNKNSGKKCESDVFCGIKQPDARK